MISGFHKVYDVTEETIIFIQTTCPLMPEKNDATFTYLFKPILLFFSAHVLNTTLHELTHAMAANMLGVDATLFHYYVNTDKGYGSAGTKSIIAFAGPIVSLLIGMISLLGYVQAKMPGMRLFLLYSAMIGIGIFFGNMFSATFGGDISRASVLLGFSSGIRYLISFLGLVLSVLFMWRMGKEFLRFGIPENDSRIKVIVYTILIPWLGGVVLVTLAYWPLPAFLVTAMVASSVFWVFTLLGSVTARHNIAPRRLLTSVHWIDVALFVITIIIVRVLTYGISFHA